VLVAVVVAVLSAPTAAGAADQSLVIDGRGWGHGVGMAQDGALSMGRAGATTDQILDQFYPGTTNGSAGGTVRVPVFTGAAPTAVGFPNGGEVRASAQGGQPPGFPVRVPPGGQVQVRIAADGRLTPVAPGAVVRHASTGDASRVVLAAAITDLAAGAPTSTTPTPPPTTAPPAPAPPVTPPPPPVEADALWAVPASGGTVAVPARGRSYRGVVQAVRGGDGLRLVNQVNVEDYLRGMGEVRDPSWPAASLAAQAVAARTYALRAMGGGGEICDTDACQVYLGAQAEYPAMDAAVRATRGKVRRYGGGLAATFYSANAGGFSATPEEGFGSDGGGAPYLRAAPYRTDDPRPWTVVLGLDDAGRRLGYPGRLSGAAVSRAGPSGRPLEVVLRGDAGDVKVNGRRVATALGLSSNLFTVRTDAAPPPPSTTAGPATGGFTAPSAFADDLLATDPVRESRPQENMQLFVAVAVAGVVGVGIAIARRVRRAS
jgi:stage II sporulation protein D